MPREHLAMSGDIFDCHDYEEGNPGIWRVQAKNGAKHSQCTERHNKKIMWPHVIEIAEGENPCCP